MSGEIELQLAILRNVDKRREFTTVELARRVDRTTDRHILERRIETHLLQRDDVELSDDRGGATWRFRPPHPDA